MSSKENRCFGIVRNYHLCKRKGDWRLFCHDHNRQWIGWLVFLIFTIFAGIVTIYTGTPQIFKDETIHVDVPNTSKLKKAINMAKMEGVKFTTESNSSIVSKFFALPIVISENQSTGNQFALVSITPYRPSSSDKVFDAGDCRFTGLVTKFDSHDKKAQFDLKSIACIDNQLNAYSIESSKLNLESLGTVRNINSPTEQKMELINIGADSYSVENFSNAIVQLDSSIKLLPYVGKSASRF
jgi:hypothetical protein